MTLLEKKTPVALRIGGIVILSIILMAAIAVGILQGTFEDSAIEDRRAKKGMVSIGKEVFIERLPIYLNGEWECYKDVFQVEDNFDYTKLENSKREFITLPTSSVVHSVGPTTYRLVLENEMNLEGYAFYLPNYNEDFAIYVNGKKIPPVYQAKKEDMVYTMSNYLHLIQFDVESGKTEIIISANASEKQSLLYLKSVVFGPIEHVNDYVAYVWRDDTFLIGCILILIIMGLIFMLIRTTADMLLSITMFDTFLAIRIILGFHVATYFLHNIIPGRAIGNIQFVGLQFFTFFLTGTMGCTLSQSIFDAQHKLSVWPLKIQNRLCIVGGVFSLLFYKKMPIICIIALFLVLLYSFFIVTWHIYHVIKAGRFNKYYAFQTVNTYYIGVLMGIDIMYLRGRSYNAMIYAYVLFMLSHLLSRLMDSNASYKKVENLNRNLEQIIDERTKELTEVNQYLSELSIRDPLTQAYNRLYFEQNMETILDETTDEPIHLCLFDLDYFKQINDKFGHGAGDEQLKFVVNTTHNILGNSGILTRVGGEEFAILFEHDPTEKVLEILEQIRAHFEADAAENEMRTTASFGVVKYEKHYTSKAFFLMADERLYQAKEQGRNSIVFH